MLTGLLFAVGAMVLNSLGGLLQSDATTRTRPGRPLVLQPRYLSGLIVDGLGWACTVVALRNLPVFAVQAILAGAIAVTALATRVLHDTRLGLPEKVAIGACLCGLILVAGSAGGDRPENTSVAVDVILGIAVVVLAVAGRLVWNGDRAWPLALIGGLGFGGTALAVRSLHLNPGEGPDPLVLVSQPATYLLLAFWIVGITTYSKALGLGSLASVTAVFAVTEVIVPGLVAIVLLGDPVRAGWGVPLAVGLLVAVTGVVVLARAPARPNRARRVR
ncbi:MAG: hypothetical protein OJJ54_18365 [Pseudonocardia sp.]|nr:hypothetical protein [Pseudonocardia sp.]